MPWLLRIDVVTDAPHIECRSLCRPPVSDTGSGCRTDASPQTFRFPIPIAVGSRRHPTPQVPNHYRSAS